MISSLRLFCLAELPDPDLIYISHESYKMGWLFKEHCCSLIHPVKKVQLQNRFASICSLLKCFRLMKDCTYSCNDRMYYSHSSWQLRSSKRRIYVVWLSKFLLTSYKQNRGCPWPKAGVQLRLSAPDKITVPGAKGTQLLHYQQAHIWNYLSSCAISCYDEIRNLIVQAAGYSLLG